MSGEIFEPRSERIEAMDDPQTVIVYTWNSATGGSLEIFGGVSGFARLRAMADFSENLAGKFENQIELLEAVLLYLLDGSLGVKAAAISDLVEAANEDNEKEDDEKEDAPRQQRREKHPRQPYRPHARNRIDGAVADEAAD